MLKDIFSTILFIVLFTAFMFVIFAPTQKDKDAYKKCVNTYDEKTCQKLIYGKYE